MTEYLVKYGALKVSAQNRPTDLLETLYMAERYREGDDLKAARERYDTSIWNGVTAADINKRLADLDRFMRALARDRAVTWGLLH
jgi:hypothetical protein